MKNKYVIGLGGVARSGKDSFCRLLCQGLYARGYRAERFALADPLKSDICGFLKHNFGIDPSNCSDENKKFIRPILVMYGAMHRQISDGKFWTGRTEDLIAASDCDVAIVTDIRYDRYQEDELFWLKSHMAGIFVHISRYDIVDGKEVFIQPANEDEMMEDPKLQAAADFKIVWESSDDETFLASYVDKFLKFVMPLIDRS